MYPFEEGLFAVENAWYVAAFSDEVTRKPMERWILDKPVAMYRQGDGTPVALHGLCPHHLYPLGKSDVAGDNIRCGYHGLEFAPSGQCVAAPFLEKIPPVCRVKSYRIVERWQWLWIWPGDPDLADESLIPDHHEIGLTNPRFRALTGLMIEAKCRYQLLNDNLLDLQHIEVLHSGNIGAPGIGRVREERVEGPNWISSFRLLKNVDVPATFKPMLGERKVDRRFGLHYAMPGLHYGHDVYLTPDDDPQPGRELARINVFHAVTPARQNTANYITAVSRDFAIDDAMVDEYTWASLPNTLNEDLFAAEALERIWQDCGDGPREMLFRSDETVVAGRRILEAMIGRELAERKPAKHAVRASSQPSDSTG